MTFIDLKTQQLRDTDDVHLNVLVAIIDWLQHHDQKTWIDVNGPESIPRLCRVIRARMFRLGRSPRGRLRAVLNNLDPPHCRCGRPGTRLIGGQTFCRHCGPDAGAQRRFSNVRTEHDHGSAIYGSRRQSYDERQLTHERARKVAKFR